MKFVLISDTHKRHRKLNIPDGDFLIHAGDITSGGEPETLVDFNNWLGELPHKHKIVIAGNHEIGWAKVPFDLKQKMLSNAIYLEDSEITIDGLKFYGSPWQKWFFDWEWNFPQSDKNGEFAKKIWSKIPIDVDILIIHGPAYMMLDKVIESSRKSTETNRDKHQGCKYLAERIKELAQLKLFVCLWSYS